MSSIRSFFRRPTLALLGGALLLAAGCAGEADIAVKCPDIRIPADTERLTRFRDGGGRDITDVRVQAEVTYLSGSCTVEDEAIDEAIQSVGEQGSVTRSLVESGALDEQELLGVLALHVKPVNFAKAQAFAVEAVRDFEVGHADTDM